MDLGGIIVTPNMHLPARATCGFRKSTWGFCVRAPLVLVLLGMGCAGEEINSPGSTVTTTKTDTETPTPTDSQTDIQTDIQTDTQTEITETQTGTGDEVTSPSTLRFAVLGDGGEGNSEQKQVADVMLSECNLAGGCEFVLYLGDNFYDSGVISVSDSQFQEKFEIPYANFDIPFYVVLGNHDYGLIPIEAEKAAYQLDYHYISDKWFMPNSYYAKRHGDVELFGLDTNPLIVDQLITEIDKQDQIDWFSEAVASSDASWKIAFGHHPYISNGQHGNAGDYEGFSVIPLVNGQGMKDFGDNHLCGKVDIYFVGHDHNRQWLEPTCGTEFVVSGAAAKTTALHNRPNPNPTFFEDDLQEGFMLVEITGNTLNGKFFDKEGNFDFERQVVK